MCLISHGWFTYSKWVLSYKANILKCKLTSFCKLGTRAFLKKFKFSAATTNDLMTVLEEAARDKEEKRGENVLPEGVSMAEVMDNW